VRRGDAWFDALLDAIARWEVTQETVDGRHYEYLVGGEAFDWLLLAERLLTAVDGKVPAEERDALLFFGRPPRPMHEEEFHRAIGDAKHRAHLNFLYGVTVEEALQLTVEEEVLKERRSLGGWGAGSTLDDHVFERIYGRTRDDLLLEFRAGQVLPESDVISFGELQAFTYWLFKYRLNQSDPARVASDTRKGLAQVSELEASARRRAQHSAPGGVNGTDVVDGEVVARVR
jgi:hypothetical protein